jgi:small subunit ribosomal protein S1
VENKEGADSPNKLADLKPSMRLDGKVTKVELFGAFVDVGADLEGLVHISMLKKGPVNRVEDVVKVGQQVEVWVQRVDPNAGRLELTMVRPVQLKWKDIKPGITIKGKVVRIENFGAFVDIGAGRPGLVHVSELSTEYVSNPTEVVQVGDEVEVSVIDLDRKKRQIRLSMKETIPDLEEDEETDKEVPTAMEFALRQALQESDQDKPGLQSTPRLGTDNEKRELDDILTRTLKQRVRTASSSE